MTALINLMLAGGNDANNWIVPTTVTEYAAYAAQRSELAIPASTLIPLAGAAQNGVTFGMHPQCPGLAAAFNTGYAAIIHNVGSLLQPTTVAEYNSHAHTPPQLFSHYDQKKISMMASGDDMGLHGWMGKINDTLPASKIGHGLTMFIDDVLLWNTGISTVGYVVGHSGPAYFDDQVNTNYRSGARAALSKSSFSVGAASANALVSAYATKGTTSTEKALFLNNALTTTGDFPAGTFNDGETLQQQLHWVARIIKARAQLGDINQSFLVSLGGFDVHDNAMLRQPLLFGQIDRAIVAFNKAMLLIDAQNSALLYTTSEFGRTRTSDAAGGCDHGWGGTHMVFGPVKEGHYGTPASYLPNDPQVLPYGRPIPTMANDQYYAALALWYGQTRAQVSTLFPNLAKFGPLPLFI